MTQDNMPQDRSIGRTTKQMQEAARGAMFVWVNDFLHYPKRLALLLGRTDLEIVSPGFFDTEGRVLGREFMEVVIDHAARLTTTQWHNVELARTRIKQPAS